MNGIPIYEWAQSNEVDDKCYYKAARERQISFLANNIQRLIGTGLDYEVYKDLYLARVISSHTSKSVKLPVVEFNREDLGIRFIMRNNFYDWKLTVISKQCILADFAGIFYTESPIEPEYTGDKLHPVYFEGFPSDLIKGYYSQNQKEFSAEINNDYDLWMVLHMTLRELMVLEDKKYTTKEEHKKQLAGPLTK